ncbi:hypothetical protein WJX74_002854 [Apatococcus lobatus]|uniref:Uncharacterized protein n=1 Tax=Apatococcus lobatus TaxID=904363 RepID=A0AAW1RMV3_9CHLO
MSSKDKLRNKRVVVIGGSSGIGFAVAEAVLDSGAEVIIASSTQSKVDGAMARLDSPSASGRTVDISSEEQLRHFFEDVGPFDHFVYTAGDALQLGQFEQTDLKKAKTALDVRFWGCIAAIKAAQKLIRPGGSITMTSGTIALKPIKDWAIATGVAGATESLTRGLALDLAPIRVNTVIPGFVATEMWDTHMSKEEQHKVFQETGKKLLTGRVASPDDIAECYLYCMKAGFTTGSNVVADGGGLLTL